VRITDEATAIGDKLSSEGRRLRDVPAADVQLARPFEADPTGTDPFH